MNDTNTYSHTRMCTLKYTHTHTHAYVTCVRMHTRSCLNTSDYVIEFAVSLLFSIALKMTSRDKIRTNYYNIFDSSFSTAVDFRAFFSGTSALRLKIDVTAVDFNTRLRCTANTKLAFNAGMSSKQSTLKCSLHRTDAEEGFQFARVR